MAAHIITSGIDYAQLLDDLRTLVRQEMTRALPPAAPSAAEIGGLALAQEITRLSKARLYALVSARGIPHTKRGNKLYFRRADLEAWVEQGRRT